jgi:prephenate dehydrogenase
LNNNPVISIIGGTGSMGKMFQDFFTQNGFEVLIAGRSTKMTITECAARGDIVIITVPIDKTVEIIKQVSPYVKKDGLLTDLTSLKSEPLYAMLKYSKYSVLGMHPIFGPGLEKFKNQTIVLCPGRGPQWLEWMKEILQKNQIKVKVCTAEKHDEMMAVIQGLIHFSTITTASVLKELNIDINESIEFSSPIYKLRLDLIGRILNQPPSLYANIEILNPKVPKILHKYIKNSKKLYKIINNKDKNRFLLFFNEISDYFGDFKKQAVEYSNYVINNLINKK